MKANQATDMRLPTIEAQIAAVSARIAKDLAARRAVRAAIRARAAYAKSLNDQHQAIWFDAGRPPAGSLARTEQTAFYAELKSTGHSNPSHVWGAIKEHARMNAIQRNLFDRLSEGGEACITTTPITADTKLTLRTLNGVNHLHKSYQSQTSLTKSQNTILTHLSAILAELGVSQPRKLS